MKPSKQSNMAGLVPGLLWYDVVNILKTHSGQELFVGLLLHVDRDIVLINDHLDGDVHRAPMSPECDHRVPCAL